MLVTVNNRLKFEIEIVHDLLCHPTDAVPVLPIRVAATATDLFDKLTTENVGRVYKQVDCHVTKLSLSSQSRPCISVNE